MARENGVAVAEITLRQRKRPGGEELHPIHAAPPATEGRNGPDLRYPSPHCAILRFGHRRRRSDWACMTILRLHPACFVGLVCRPTILASRVKMSEFSDSYHIRTDDAAETKRLLRQARFAGITFGPSHGWLTFVPYDEDRSFRQSNGGEQFALRLSRALSATVLYYNYYEDHGWGFALATPQGVASSFACWWLPELAVERDRLDLEPFRPLANSEALTPLLQQSDGSKLGSLPPAYQFAELLRLPAYKWLSPRLAQRDTDSLLAQGGRKLGTRPPTLDERMQLPPLRTLTLPRPDLSAREALEIVAPSVRRLGEGWRLVRLVGHGRLKPDGRLHPRAGSWRFVFLDPNNRRKGALEVNLHANGNLAFKGLLIPEEVASGQMAVPFLDDSWLDSGEIAESVRGEPFPDGTCHDLYLIMSLAPVELMASLAPIKGLPLMWEVGRSPDVGYQEEGRAHHTLMVDAATGQLMLEMFIRQKHQKTIERRMRIRTQPAEWEDMAGDW